MRINLTAGNSDHVMMKTISNQTINYGKAQRLFRKEVHLSKWKWLTSY